MDDLEPSRTSSGESLVEGADRLRLEGRWRQMIDCLRPPLEAGLEDARGWALLAQAWLLGGRDVEAAAAVEAGLAVSEEDDFVQAALARLLLRQGDSAGAERAAERALRLNPAEPDHRLLVAALAAAAGRTEQALVQVDVLLADHPSFAAAHAQRAMLCRGLNRPAEALSSGRAAAALGFRHPDAWRVMSAVGDTPAAIEALRYRLGVDPADALAMISLGELLRASGQTEEALSWLGQAVEIRPGDPKAWAGYGTTLQESVRNNEARTAYRRSLDLQPDNPGVGVNLAAIDYGAGRYEAVLAALEPLVAAGRASPVVHMTLGAAYAQLGDPEAAARSFEAARALDPTHLPALRALGRTAEEAGRLAKTAAAGLLTLNGLEAWLQLLASEPRLGDALATFDRFAGAVQAGPRERARLAVYPLLARWAEGDMEAVSRLLACGRVLEVKEMSDRIPHRFFHYVERLAAFRSACPAFYADAPGLGDVEVLGESHALGPANLVGTWRGRAVRFRARLVRGVKMFSLAGRMPTLYSAQLGSHLEAISDGADLLFAIGEIDCRPDEGIWSVHRRTGRAVPDIIADTVEPYLDSLGRLLGGRAFGSVAIQGVPAPAYPVREQLAPGERVADFLAVIRGVNAALEAGAHTRGWDHLDIFGHTAGPDGLSNRLWHIDGYHLSPRFYREAVDAARRHDRRVPP